MTDSSLDKENTIPKIAYSWVPSLVGCDGIWIGCYVIRCDDNEYIPVVEDNNKPTDKFDVM